MARTLDISNPDELGGNTAVVTSVSSSASNQTLKVANLDRNQIIIQNDSTQILYVKYGATATSSDYTIKVLPDDVLVTSYTGRIDGIWVAANGSAKVTEIA
jgi:hypothetical protein